MQNHRPNHDLRSVVFKTLALCLVVFLLLAGSGSAAQGGQVAPSMQEQQWWNLAFFGGPVTAILVDPGSAQTIYAGTPGGGVFKSVDAGNTWQPARAGLPGSPIRCLVMAQPGTLYAGTNQNGVWKTADGGASWSFAGAGIDKTLNVNSLVVDPANPNILYAGAGGAGGQIYKSANAGATWQVKSTGIPVVYSGELINDVLALIIDPANPAVLYAGTQSAGVFATANGGESWTAMTNGLPYQSMPYYGAVNALSPIPGTPGQVAALYVGKYWVYKDAAWQMVNEGTEYANSGVGVAHLYFHPSDPNTIYAAGMEFKVSVDGGKNWVQRLGWPDSGYVRAAAFYPGSPNTIYAATDYLSGYSGGVWITPDQGLTWAHPTQDPAAHRVTSVAVDPLSPTRMYAGTGEEGAGSFYFTPDGGRTWLLGRITTGTQPNYDFGEIYKIVVDPQNTQRIYATALFTFFVSSDGGQSFVESDPFSFPEGVAVPFSGPAGVVYASSRVPGKGIYKSTDAGVTWAPRNTGVPYCNATDICSVPRLVADPNNANTLWAGTNGGGIVKTTDGGDHWIVKGLVDNGRITAIAVHPYTSNTVLAATSDGTTFSLFRTFNGGETWAKLRDVPSPVTDIVYNGVYSHWVYLITDGSGVMRSPDGGSHWGTYSNGLFNLSLSSAVYVPGTAPHLLSTELLVGSLGSGLYQAGAGTTSIDPFHFFYLPLVRK